MDDIPAIKKAFAIANQANLTREELNDLEHRAVFIHDQRNAIKKAERLGLEQGIKQGIEQGELRAKIAIARQLLDVFDDSEISRTTGLSLAAIAQLRN